MKIRLFILFSLAFSSLHAQQPKPANWNETVDRPWYRGQVLGQAVFVFLDSLNRDEGYFFIADKSLPDIYQLILKHKGPFDHILRFRMHGKKLKATLDGTIQNKVIKGTLQFSRKNAKRLDIIREVSLNLSLEPPCKQATGSTTSTSSPPPHIPMPPCPPASMQPRYLVPIFQNVDFQENIAYGADDGYYVTMPLNNDSIYDYQEIILEALQNMYISPSKKVLMFLLNQDPISLAMTNMQGLYLDIYQPEGDTMQKRPLLLLLHGGAFILGDKGTSTVKELAFDFARKGYVVAAINYRMGFNPASKSSLERSAYRAVQDARAALRYLSYNATNYRIDPDQVYLGGSSAGAITALNTAFMEENERPESTHGSFWKLQNDLGGLDESTNKYEGSYSIRAVANLWGAVGDTNIIDAYEQFPVLSFHGDADKIVPYGCNYPFTDLDTTWTSSVVNKLYGSFLINRRLTDLGIHNELVVFPGAGHEPQYEGNNHDRIMDTITNRVTGFYYRSMFYFPALTGTGWVAINTPPPAYSLPWHDDIGYYWHAAGGKIVPGDSPSQVRAVWLTETAGRIELLMVNRNRASMEIDRDVILPDRMMNYFPVKK